MTEAFPPPIDAPQRRPWRPLRYLLLGVVGIFAIIGVLFVALVVWGIRGAMLMDEAGAAGRKFGSGSSDVECFHAAVERHSGGYSDYFNLGEIEFLRECLTIALPTVSFCEGIPALSDAEGFKAWYEARCSEIDIPIETCFNLFEEQQYHCLERHTEPSQRRAPGKNGPEDLDVDAILKQWRSQEG